MAQDKGSAAVALAGSKGPEQDEQLYHRLIETPKAGRRATDENSAFSLFMDFLKRMLTVALNKGHSKVRVGRLIQGAVDAGIFNEVEEGQRYRRGYNYFTQQKKNLPEGWIVDKVNGKNHCIYTKQLPTPKAPATVKK